MDDTQNPNLAILILAVDRLGDLSDKMVFLGGCATGLLISDPASPPIRVTKDVDAIVQVYSRSEYYKLSDQLKGKGFKEDHSDGAPLCRWVVNDVILDVMPTDEKILGFSNHWYESAINNPYKIMLPNGRQINLVSPAYFLITKLEAFDGRGKGDFLLSHDIEDIVAVLDGRPELLDEIQSSDEELVKVLSIRFKELGDNRHFVDAIYGHMPTDEASQSRVALILKLIKKISEL